MEDIQHRIVFCSPSGSTKHVAGVIEAELRSRGCLAESHELWQGSQCREPMVRDHGPERVCLWLGSPVYALHPVPPVMELLAGLRTRERLVFAVPFVTYGGVTSGTALADLAHELTAKGYSLLGGAKILAVHSTLWQAKAPLGQGHPDQADDELIRGLVHDVLERLEAGDGAGIDPEALDYQPEEVRKQAAERSIAAVLARHPGFGVHPERCTQCGICQESCPAGAIALTPSPEFNEACFLCHNCVRLCPESAITTDTHSAEERLRSLAATFQESPPSAVFP